MVPFECRSSILRPQNTSEDYSGRLCARDLSVWLPWSRLWDLCSPAGLTPPIRVLSAGGSLMKYICDTNLMISESTLTLVYPKDWSQEGVTRLPLWFRGDAANAAERMFVALNSTAVVYHDDPAATQMTGWIEWSIKHGCYCCVLALLQLASKEPTEPAECRRSISGPRRPVPARRGPWCQCQS